jgi:hypothetical protein
VQVIDVDEEFIADGVKIRAFPVLHGGDYVSLGFHIGTFPSRPPYFPQGSLVIILTRLLRQGAKESSSTSPM